METNLIFKTIKLDTNQGLGLARQVGINACSFDIVAIMDSDDLCVTSRFLKQTMIMNKHPEFDVVGSLTYEFCNDSPSQIIGFKHLPEDDKSIKEFMQRRCPFNHQTVMMRKAAVLGAGNYLSWHYNEDYYLWIRMAQNGAVFYNIQEPLVYFRINDGLYKRRGGKAYYKSERDIQRLLLDNKLISKSRYYYNTFIRFLFQRLFPPILRGTIYKLSRRKIGRIASPAQFSSPASEQRFSETKFSVLTNVYANDNPCYVGEMFETIANQSLLPNEIIVVIDGPITDGLNQVIDYYRSVFEKLGRKE